MRHGWRQVANLARLKQSTGTSTVAEVKPLSVLEHMHRALNAHDIDAFVELFSPDYRSEQPAHPDREFGGREQVRENWGGTFVEHGGAGIREAVRRMRTA